jgi:hypothetical protein
MTKLINEIFDINFVDTNYICVFVIKLEKDDDYTLEN